MKVLVDFLQIEASEVAQIHVLQSPPKPFRRVEIGRVGRKEFYPELLLAHVLDEALYLLAAVNGGTIPDDEEALSSVA
jgi:hypothetical protein